MKRFYPLAILALLALGLAAPASAATVVVNTTTDQSLGSCSSSCSLRDAVATANSGDTIQIPAGTYVLTLGDIISGKDLTIVGAGARSTVLDGNGASRIFQFPVGFPVQTVELDDLALIHGLAATPELATGSFGGGALAGAANLTLALARILPLGTVVTVDGSVTTPSGVFASSFFDEGFAVQDRTGGIYVSIADNLGLNVREQARVTGTLAEIGGLLVLLPVDGNDVKVHGKGPKVEPLRVPTGGIGEATEGRLVQIVGTIDQPVVNDLPFGYKVFVNDGSGEIRVFVNLGTGIDVSGLAAGQRVRVTGFSGQFIDYEIDPRFPSDIKVEP